MTPEYLYTEVARLADGVLADARWAEQRDDLGVSILGMILYGFALAKGRLVMLLDIEDIDATVARVITDRVGAAQKWTSGLVAVASASAFDQQGHPGEFELIGVGHSYFGVSNQAAVIDNVFANLESFRRAASSEG